MHQLAERLGALNRAMEALLGERASRLLRYLISGGTAAAANIGLLFALVQFTGMHYLPASVASFLASVAVSFTMQKFWTFQDASLRGAPMQFGRYLVVLCGNLALNTVLMYLLVDEAGLWYLYAQVLATVAVAVAGYFGYRHFVFRAVPAALP